MKNWKDLKAEIDRAAVETLIEPDEEVVSVFKYGISKGGAGVPDDNQIFTTWFFGGADVNYLSDWCYFLNELLKQDDFTMAKLVQTAKYWIIQPSEFGSYCGLTRQYRFTKELVEIIDTLKKEELQELVDSFRTYLSNINAWVFQFFPWGLGYAFPRKDEAYLKKVLSC